MGMANAFIAVADDATAASWNPAGLIQLQEPELSFAGEAIFRFEDVDSPSNPEVTDATTLRLGDLNYASLVYPFFLKTSMVFSLNYLTFYRFERSFEFPVLLPASSEDALAVQFHFDFEQEGVFSVLAPAYAIFINSKLSLGISLNIWNHALTDSSSYDRQQSLKGTFLNPSRPDFLVDFEARLDEEFEVDEGYSVVLGGLYRFNEHWNIGVVIKPGFELNLDHTSISSGRRVDRLTGQILGETFPKEDKKDADLKFPSIVGGGIAWRPTDAWTLSSDVTWTNWSKYLFVQNNVDFNPISGRPIREGKLDDTFTMRLGCEYLLIRDTYLIPFRGGVGYDPAPAVGGVDDFYTISLGSGIQFGRYNFDVAWEFRWGDNVNSDIFQGIDASQDIRQHRVLASFIYYF